MKLVRNTTKDGSCKYAIIRLDKLRTQQKELGVDLNLNQLFNMNPQSLRQFVEFGFPGDNDEFFVIKLKDVNAASALEAYAKSAVYTDPELANEVLVLVERAKTIVKKKIPD